MGMGDRVCCQEYSIQFQLIQNEHRTYRPLIRSVVNMQWSRAANHDSPFTSICLSSVFCFLSLSILKYIPFRCRSYVSRSLIFMAQAISPKHIVYLFINRLVLCHHYFIAPIDDCICEKS